MIEIIPPFQEYAVPGVGTVIDPQGEPGYRVRLPGGVVTAFAALSGDPSEANAAADIAHAIAHPAGPNLDEASIYAQQLAPGYLDAETGLRLKTVQRAQTKFASMVTLLELAVSQGAVTPATQVTLFDFDDVAQTLTIAAFRGLMLRYGFFCKGLFDEFAP